MNPTYKELVVALRECQKGFADIMNEYSVYDQQTEYGLRIAAQMAQRSHAKTVDILERVEE